MNSCIITAGGTGSRMKSDIPKQFHLLAGKPVLMRTLELFYFWDKKIELILSLHPEYFQFWEDLCAEHNFTVPHRVVSGGATRFESVKNALEFIGDEGFTAVHDGVRPLCKVESIAQCFDTAQQHGTGIAAQDIVFSIRKMNSDGQSKAVNRAEYKEIQTPQVFRNDILKQAYNLPYQDFFTDDASVVEAAGFPIILAEGSRQNIKLTTPEDFLLADRILKTEKL